MVGRLLLYAGKRLLFVPFAVLIIVSLSWALVNVIPSNPAREQLGELASPTDIAAANHALGLDQSLGHRYAHYMDRLVLHFDLGKSYDSSQTVLGAIKLYLPNTLELVVMSLALAAVLGIAVGTFGALFRGRMPDQVSRIYTAATQAVPDFFLGLILIFLVFYKLEWAPAPTGRLGILDVPPPARTNALLVDCILAHDWSALRAGLAHSILPVVTLAVAESAFFGKTTRTVMGRALDSYQVEFARACGLPRRQVLGYAFRVARTPIITFGGILFAGTVGGAAIVETIFNWGGIGQWGIDRILHLDLPSIQGFVLVLGLLTLLVFVMVDVLVIFLDPRVSID